MPDGAKRLACHIERRDETDFRRPPGHDVPTPAAHVFGRRPKWCVGGRHVRVQATARLFYLRAQGSSSLRHSSPLSHRPATLLPLRFLRECYTFAASRSLGRRSSHFMAAQRPTSANTTPRRRGTP